jgi:protein-tyrosine phosphatase
MIDASKPKYVLASSASTPPTSSSYWVVPSLLLAGAYPGDSDPDERRRKMQALVDAGVRAFVNLMQEDETNWAGVPFVPYVDVAQQFCPNVVCVRHPIQDLSVPTASEMCDMLDTIDQYLESQKAVYVHCWGGVGRTGTVIGCWLLRHRLAEPSDVLDVLMRLRQQDRERRNRMSPETGEQQAFVRQWPERDGTR